MIGTETWTQNPAGSPDFIEDEPEPDESAEPQESEDEEPFSRNDFLGDLKKAAKKAAKRLTTEERQSSEEKS